MSQNDFNQAFSQLSEKEKHVWSKLSEEQNKDLGFLSSPPTRALLAVVDGAKEGDPVTAGMKALAKEGMAVLQQVSGE
ncbi:hypothetical protein [Streptomyces avermitilis]|uniref:hypothetical protein n=1 Tax=Streptomyces avermitilis TaxID=33903 RepID=UPI00380298F9